MNIHIYVAKLSIEKTSRFLHYTPQIQYFNKNFKIIERNPFKVNPNSLGKRKYLKLQKESTVKGFVVPVIQTCYISRQLSRVINEERQRM